MILRTIEDRILRNKRTGALAGIHVTSANWFDEIMTYHDMSPKVTMLN